jgi:aminopeptidase
MGMRNRVSARGKEVPMDPRLKKLAKLLVHYSAGVKASDKVFLECDEVATPWMAAMAEEALKTGAHVETLIGSEMIGEIRLKHSSEEQLKIGGAIGLLIAQTADVVLSAWGSRNTRINSGIPAQKLKCAAQGRNESQRIFMDRMGKGELRWCGTQYPTEADAQEANMSLSDYEDFVYGAGLLDSENPVAEWKRISAEQERWVGWLDGKSELHIVAEGTDLRVKVAGRKWMNCDGHVNFPDGEIFTSPVEDGIDGHITFSFPGIYAGREVEGICLDVEKGLIVKATATKGEDLLHALMDTDEGAKRFGEVAIGTNYGIRQFTRNMLFDEKIGGTVHMAIGDSMADAGGLNRSTIHWDMLCDLRTGGRIFADDILFYENGMFLENVLA